MHSTHLALPRRGLLAGAALVGTAGLLANPSLAKVTMPTGQAPYFYRFKLGDAQATPRRRWYPTARCCWASPATHSWV